jgi:hypothetical protein
MHLFNTLSRKASYNPDAVELFDRLLWLRNHYECDVPERGFDETLRRSVLEKIDETLNKYAPQGLRSEDRHAVTA